MAESNTLSRLKQFLDYKGISVRAFEQKVGFSNGSFASQLKNGKTIGVDRIENILREFPDINAEWLLTGKGEMLHSQDKEDDFSKKISTFGSASGVASDVSVEYDPGNEKIIDSTNSTILMQTSSRNEISSGKVIPYYDAEVAAGTSYGMDMTPANPVGMIEIGGLLKDSEFAMRVYGNSMTPNYPAGCVIGLRAYNEHFIEPGTVYVVETSENRFLKRLYYNKDKSAFRCLSDNHMKYESGPMEGEYFYPEFEIPLCDIQRLHQVTGVIKRNVL